MNGIKLLAVIGIFTWGFLGGYLTLAIAHGERLDPQSMYLQPEDSSAEIFIDGRLVGTGPVCMPWVPKGVHEFTFVTNGLEETMHLRVRDTYLDDLTGTLQDNVFIVMKDAGSVKLGCPTEL